MRNKYLFCASCREQHLSQKNLSPLDNVSTELKLNKQFVSEEFCSISICDQSVLAIRWSFALCMRARVVTGYQC